MNKDFKNVDMYEQSNLPKNHLWFWIGQNLQPDAPIFNMPMAITINGKVDHQRFSQAFQQVVNRSDALRSVIIPQKGVPFREVIDRMDYQVELLDLSQKDDPQAVFSDWADSRCRVVFDMQQRMFDSVLVKMAENQYIWYWCQHHLICDGWSTALVYRYVAEFYQASFNQDLDQLDGFPQFEEYALREREYRHSDAHEKSRLFWEQQFKESLDSFNIYGKTGREHGTTEVLRVTRDLGEYRTEQIKKLSMEKNFRNFSQHLSIFQLFSTCLFSYLYRISGNETLAIGSLYHNRQSPQDKQTIGFYMEMAPIRVSLSATDSFEQVFSKIKKSSNEVLRHYRFAPGNPIHQRSYDVALNYNNASYPDFAGIPISLSWLHTGTWYPHEPLAIQIHDFDETGTFTIAFDFNCGVFDEVQRERAITHFFNCIDALIASPAQAIGEFDILTEEEKSQIFRQLSSGEKMTVPSCCVHELIAQQAQQTPSAIAVYNSQQSLTYAELESRANNLAHYLIGLGVACDALVGISMLKTPEVIVAILGVLKAGAGYVPIDPDYPAERLTHMINDSGLKVLLSHSNISERLPQGDYQLVEYDKAIESINQQPPTTPVTGVNPANLAYVIYTSGSTGQAKGVMIEQHSIVNYALASQQAFGVSEKDKVLQFASISFDAAAEEIYTALISGASLCLVEDEMKSSMKTFVDALESEQITLLDLPTAFWHQLTIYLKDQNRRLPACIHTLIIGGERAQPQIVADWFELGHRAIRLFNTYGPTETTIVASICELTPENTQRNSEVAIGKPVNNYNLYVLDKARQPLPLGVVGELYIGGAGVARGYLGRDQLTAECFTDDPFVPGQRIYKSGDLVCYRSDGLLEYRDRVDDQVKIRGFRIELGEVEAALMAIEGVEQAVVLAKAGLNGDKRIVAYFKPSIDESASITQVRSALRQRLPDYMIPQHFFEIDEFPLNQSGKVNKRLLPDIVTDESEEDLTIILPETNEEKLIAAVWQKYLGDSRIGRFDNFFDAGGDSLSMMQVVAALEAELEFKLAPRMLVTQNLAQLAAELATVKPVQSSLKSKVFNSVRNLFRMPS